VFSSLPLLLVLTAMFAATGLYSLVRLSALASGAATEGDRVAELSHLLMSIAMLGMTWGWTGGPLTPSGVVQLVLFGLLSVWFLVPVLRPGGHHWMGRIYHLVVQVAMVWMVAAMPALMGMGGAATAASGHEGHGATADVGEMTGMVMSGPPPWWVHLVTVAFVMLLCVAALAWAIAAVRPARVPVPAATAAAPSEPGPAAPRGIRLDAGCHLLMSLGMAGMFLAML